MKFFILCLFFVSSIKSNLIPFQLDPSTKLYLTSSHFEDLKTIIPQAELNNFDKIILQLFEIQIKNSDKSQKYTGLATAALKNMDSVYKAAFHSDSTNIQICVDNEKRKTFYIRNTSDENKEYLKIHSEKLQFSGHWYIDIDEFINTFILEFKNDATTDLMFVINRGKKNSPINESASWCTIL